MSNKKLSNKNKWTKHTEKLNKLITDGADYNEILKQSQIIDRYIVKELSKKLK